MVVDPQEKEGIPDYGVYMGLLGKEASGVIKVLEVPEFFMQLPVP